MYPQGSKAPYPYAMESDNGKRPPTSQPGVPESTLKRHKPAEPSKVVHVRNLPDQTNELELSELVRNFGNVNKTLLLSAKRQAFIELDSIDAATNLVNTFSINPPLLRGKQVMFQYSTRSEISLNENHERFGSVPPSKILLVSIADMRALVQIEHLEQVFSAHGVLNKIVIFEKNGFHAFVEMKSTEEATRALSRLHGQSLFVGCCTLSVQYSTLEKLSMPQVPDQRKARDYQALRDPAQAQRLALQQQQQHQQQPQIQQHGGGGNGQGAFGGNTGGGVPPHQHQQGGGGGNGVNQQAQASAARFFQQQGVMGGGGGMQHQMQQMGGSGGPGMFGGNQQGFNPMGGFHGPGGFGGRPGGGQGGMMGLGGMGGHMGQRGGPMVLDNRISLEPGGVILVNNLDESKVSPDALFNLFGVFGDVYRVKILFKKKSSALVQMANANQAALALNFLNRHTLWGQELYLTHSKFQEVQLPRQGSGIDPDSDEANLTKDYSSSRGHRFRRVDSKNFKNVCAPSAILHLANLHEGATEQELYDLFKEFGVRRVQFFNVNRAMALVEAPDSDVASQILMKYHNTQLGDRHVKISFSKKSAIPDFSNSGNNGQKSAAAAAASAPPSSMSAQPGGDAASSAAGIAGSPLPQASATSNGDGTPAVPSE